MFLRVAAGLALLVSLVCGCATQSTNASLTADPTANTKFGAAALADAVLLGQPYGANVVYWPYKGDRVVAYLIYRDTQAAPIAIVEGTKVHYIDSATPPPQAGQTVELTDVSISIDETTGHVTEYALTPAYGNTAAATPSVNVDQTTLTVTCQRYPLDEGSHTGYAVQTLYVAYNTTGLDGQIGHPDAYALKLGAKNTVTNRVTLLRPPVLYAPMEGFYPQDGNFRCNLVSGATEYVLQLSPSGDFPLDDTVTIQAQTGGSLTAVANLSLATMYSDPILAGAAGRAVYWRFLARRTGDATPLALQDIRQSGGVASTVRSFTLPNLPPT
jgi:hypothetical protein